MGHVLFDAAQDKICFLGWKHMLPAHVEFLTHQYPQVWQAALNPIIVWSTWILGLVLTKVQDLGLGLFESYDVPTSPFLVLFYIPLHGIPSLGHINGTVQLGVFCQPAEGAPGPSAHVTVEENSSGPSADPWWTSFTADLHLDIEQLITFISVWRHFIPLKFYFWTEDVERKINANIQFGTESNRNDITVTEKHTWLMIFAWVSKGHRTPTA